MSEQPDTPLKKSETIIHATLVQINNRGVLLMGPSGAGKSDLALRLIGAAFSPAFCPSPPILVADDQVILTVENDRICGHPPEKLQGLIEARSVGIRKVPFCAFSPISLIVTLTPGQEPERMPPPDEVKELLPGRPLPCLSLDPQQPSAPLKIILATGIDAK